MNNVTENSVSFSWNNLFFVRAVEVKAAAELSSSGFSLPLSFCPSLKAA